MLCRCFDKYNVIHMFRLIRLLDSNSLELHMIFFAGIEFFFFKPSDSNKHNCMLVKDI